VFHRAHHLAATIHVFARGTVPHELFPRYRVLPARQSPEVLFPHFTLETPLVGELAVPLAAYVISLGVVVLPRIRELLFVIGLRPGRTQRFGESQHDLLEVRISSGPAGGYAF
jgi:hypothetical protein